MLYDSFMGQSDETHALRLVPSGVTYLEPEEAVFRLMIQGFRNQLKSRRLKHKTTVERLQHIEAFHRFLEFRYPWQWTAALWDEFMASLVDRRLALGTIRAYQGDLHQFVSYIRNAEYGWPEECRRRFGADCPLICHEGNMIVHASEYEGPPDRRAFTYDELDKFFACADGRFEALRTAARKGALQALRNSVMLKSAYAFGLRRYSLTMLDITDFGPNPKVPRFGQFGIVTVRHGKSVKGGQPRRYPVFAVPQFEWAIQAIKQYISDIRPYFRNSTTTAALFLTERGTRIGKAHVNEIFDEIRDDAGLPSELTLHCLRHSFSTHLTEFGYDRNFVQSQLGHEHPSATSIYTHVGMEFKQLQIKRAIRRTLNETTKATTITQL